MQNNNMSKVAGVLALAMFVAVMMPSSASANGYYLLQSFDAPAVMTCNPENPQIYSITPNTAGVGSNGRIVTVFGACFTVNSVARFDGQNRVTVFINSNELKMETTNEDMSVAGKHLVNVLDPNSGLSNAVTFTVTSPVVTKATVVTGSPVAAVKTTKSATVASVTTKKATTTNESATGSVAGAQDSSLTANALSSGASFVPDTLLEWVFLFILILLGVKLWRNATVTEKEKNAPLKHA